MQKINIPQKQNYLNLVKIFLFLLKQTLDFKETFKYNV